MRVSSTTAVLSQPPLDPSPRTGYESHMHSNPNPMPTTFNANEIRWTSFRMLPSTWLSFIGLVCIIPETEWVWPLMIRHGTQATRLIRKSQTWFFICPKEQFEVRAATSPTGSHDGSYALYFVTPYSVLPTKANTLMPQWPF